MHAYLREKEGRWRDDGDEDRGVVWIRRLDIERRRVFGCNLWIRFDHIANCVSHKLHVECEY